MVLTRIALTPAVGDYLDFADVTRCTGVSRAWFCAFGSQTKAALRKHGVEPALRLRFWAHAAGVAALCCGSDARFVAALDDNRAPAGATGCSTGVPGEIARDIGRTFPSTPMFSEASDGRSLLGDQLSAVAAMCPEVGYCQGMNFVSATLLLVAAHGGSAPLRGSRDEAVCFWLMVAFVKNFGMCELWRPGVPQLKMRTFQFDRLLALKLPALHAHFRAIDLTPDFFASQWFMTLLSYNLPFETLVRVWDLLVAEGWKTIFRVGIALLRMLEPELRKLDLEELSRHFRDRKGLLDANPSSLVAAALEVKVSSRMLSDLEAEYVQHSLRRALAESADSPVAVDPRIAAGVRAEIARIETPMRGDVKVLRGKIESAERARAEAQRCFEEAAWRLVLLQTDLEELWEAKSAVSQQLRGVLAATRPTQATDFGALRRKIEAIQAQIRMLSRQSAATVFQATQAQVELEEVLERKRAFSELLVLLIAQSEAGRRKLILRARVSA